MPARRDVVLGLAVMAAAPLAGSMQAKVIPVGADDALAALLPWIEAVADGRATGGTEASP